MNPNAQPPPDHTHPPHQRRVPPKPGPIDHSIIAVLGILSALMLGISLKLLSTEIGPLANVKVLLVTCSAGLVAYGVNRLTIERGAALAAVGYPSAAFASVASILIVGSGMFIGAYSGLVIEDVRVRTLERHGSALSAYAAQTNVAALELGGMGSALQVVSEELDRLAVCERRSSCLSGIGSGGYGSVASMLQGLSSRAQGIARAFSDGQALRRQQIKEINRLTASYQAVMQEHALSLPAKRGQLALLHAEIEQAVSELAEALPVDLLAGLTDELLRGVTITGQAEATQRVNDALTAHGQTLKRAAPERGLYIPEAPSFPAVPGMLDSLRFIAEFAAFAAVIFVAEMVLPITLWVLTFLKLRWEVDKHDPPQPPQPPTQHPTSRIEDNNASPAAKAPARKRATRAKPPAGGES